MHRALFGLLYDGYTSNAASNKTNIQKRLLQFWKPELIGCKKNTSAHSFSFLFPLQLLKLQDALNNFLLETTRVMFDDMENIDQLVTNIMTFTKDLVSADRCALFLVDEER